MTMTRKERVDAIRFLISQESPAKLVIGNDPVVLTAVLRMVEEDAPMDLVMTDPALYRTLRGRVTDLRIEGW